MAIFSALPRQAKGQPKYLGGKDSFAIRWPTRMAVGKVWSGAGLLIFVANKIALPTGKVMYFFCPEWLTTWLFGIKASLEVVFFHKPDNMGNGGGMGWLMLEIDKWKFVEFGNTTIWFSFDLECEHWDLPGMMCIPQWRIIMKIVAACVNANRSLNNVGKKWLTWITPKPKWTFVWKCVFAMHDFIWSIYAHSTLYMFNICMRAKTIYLCDFFVYLSINLFIYLSIYIYLCIYLSIYVSIYLILSYPIYLSIDLSIYRSSRSALPGTRAWRRSLYRRFPWEFRWWNVEIHGLKREFHHNLGLLQSIIGHCSYKGRKIGSFGSWSSHSEILPLYLGVFGATLFSHSRNAFSCSMILCPRDTHRWIIWCFKRVSSDMIFA